MTCFGLNCEILPFYDIAFKKYGLSDNYGQFLKYAILGNFQHFCAFPSFTLYSTLCTLRL